MTLVMRALQEADRLQMEFVGPEHLAMAILSVGECGARRVLARWGCH
jgi:Clp amino terminal domain, pathogenicity island component